MPIISKETWDKFTQEEKEKIKQAMKEIPNEKASVETLLIELFPAEALQPQPLTYEDVAMELFKDGAWQFMDGYMGSEVGVFEENANETYPMNMTSKKQVEKLLAINKLLNVAKFLNGKDWKPDEGNVDEFWVLGICKYNDEIEPICVGNYDYRTEIVYFRTEELAKQAIKILGKDTVRLALSSDY